MNSYDSPAADFLDKTNELALGAGLNSVCLTADCRRALAGYDDGSIAVWNIERLERQVSFRKHTGKVLSVAISVDGRLGVSGGEDRSVRLWRLPPLPASSEPQVNPIPKKQDK